jgi:Domain of unknown function (DUF4386)
MSATKQTHVMDARISEIKHKQVKDVGIPDPRWKDLYKIGGICGVLMSVLTILAIVIYFIWPYKPGLASAIDIFTTIQNNKLNGLMSLDFFMVVITVITVPFFLALYFATKKVNESYALIALVFGLISCVLGLTMRPIAEMFYLSGQYATATTDAARSQYLAAGEALSALFNGTIWMLYFLTFGVDLLISSLLMLRTKIFSRTTAYLGIFLNIGLLSIFAFIPGFALYATIINLVTTIVGAIWNVLVARTFFQLAGSKSSALKET